MTYSFDLVYSCLLYYNKLQSSRMTATIFDLSKSTICRLYNKYKDYIKNNITCKAFKLVYFEKNPIERPSKVGHILSFLKRSLVQNPFQTLLKLNIKVMNKFNILLSTQTISNYLKIINFTKKKATMKIYNGDLNILTEKRKQFNIDIKKINHKDIIAIDETYINSNIYYKHGYTNKKRLVCNIDAKLVPKKQSILMAISNSTIIKCECFKKNITSTIYAQFLSTLHDKYILMDNVSFHKSKIVNEILAKNNCTPLFIPPYTPENNPIEEFFSTYKSYIRRNITLNNLIDVTGITNKFTKYIVKDNPTIFGKLYNRALNS